MEDAPEDPLQEDGTSQLNRSSVEDAELPELSCLTSNKPRKEGHQFIEHRVDQGRSVSPTPSYLSMKSEQSMSKPINFKEQDRTQEEMVQLERSGSPTPSCVSMRSDSSMHKTINFRDGGSTERVSEGLCDPCYDDDTERRAVKFCPTCCTSYCEKHVRRHYREAVLKTHTLVDVAEEVRSLGEERLQKPKSINVLPPPGQIQFLSVKSDSVTLRWGSPEGLEGPMNFKVTWEGDGEEKTLKVKDINKVEITGLQPGQDYEFSVATEGDHGNQSKCVSASTYTVVPPPGNLKVDRSGAASFNLRWSKAPGMEHIPQQFLITCTSPGEESLAIHTDHCYRTLTKLQPGVQYTVGVSTVLLNEQQSKPLSTTINTSVPVPDKLRVSVDSTSATLSWEPPGGMDQTQLQYQVSYQCPGGEQHTTTTSSVSITLSDLRPASEYSVSVCSLLDNRQMSLPVSQSFTTDIEPPRYITVNTSTTTSISISWGPPDGLEEQRFKLEWSSGGYSGHDVTNESSYNITNLMPGRQYKIKVATIGDKEQLSKFLTETQKTEPTSPLNLEVKKVKTTSVTLWWDSPINMEEGSYTFIVEYSCNGGLKGQQTTESNSAVLSNLEPGTSYTFNVATMLQNGSTSLRATLIQRTNLNLMRVLENLGLGHRLGKKLTIQEVKQIGEDTVLEKDSTDLPSQLKTVLKRLLMANMTARGLHSNRTSHDQKMTNPNENLNPLDLITALFLCSDGMLQQELSLKMSLCQFAVPLLLPNPDTHQSTLMLWAMRDIVKQFRSQSGEIVEKSIVDTDLPMVSFVRCGDSSLSKSKFLNEVLSSSQHSHNTFVHHNMRGGNIPKMISDGLVEVSWYLPRGNPNSDIFPEPVAVANLHGDIQDFQSLFQFLCKASAAMFVYCDNLDFGESFSGISQHKMQLFIVCNSQSKRHDDNTELKKLDLQLGNHSAKMIKKEQTMNDADLVDRLRSAVTDVLNSNPVKMGVKTMATVAHDSSIHVDEHNLKLCEKGKSNAGKITDKISDIPKYKDKQLPLQGNTWRQLTKLEKEECKLEKTEHKIFEKSKLREDQVNSGMTESVDCFINCLKTDERYYFLKWMKINLDNLCRDQSQIPTDSEDTGANRNEPISNSSLGTEHFLREVGQLYEASVFFEETTPVQKEIKELPRICAELMLAGFPLELMDGDTSNIPMTWITDVLKELDSLTKPHNKIRVVTVIGPQSSGKSTLLNTMFGVQFAVSSGRCTRGAFMQLINVEKDFRDVVKCDFIMIIDTEGLKAVELSHLTDNYIHDNELATLVVGLSDISIVNIAMENNSDMTDILQIVAHAFLRMKGVGKNPSCQFVHQNVTDISATAKNLRDRNCFLEQLNTITKAASEMENMAEKYEFTDIINYKAEETCYLPGLWQGSPPMAPVNQGYSEGVAKIKNNLIKTFTNSKDTAGTYLDFCTSVQDVWKAVKYENFIFSFRNSLVAQAYNKLSQEFGGWEWEFEKSIYQWLRTAETRVENYGLMDQQEESGLDAFEKELETEANYKLEKEGNVFLKKITDYYNTGNCDVQLLEKYKEEFKTCAESQRRTMDNIVQRKLEVAVDLRKCTFRVDNIKKNNREMMDKKVSALVELCQDKWKRTDPQLEQEFGKMWSETLKQLSFKGLESQNVAQLITTELQSNLEREGPKVKEMLKNSNPIENCGKDPFKVKESKILEKIKNKLSKETKKMDTAPIQEIANAIIIKCEALVKKVVEEKKDYHPAHTKELLELVQENLNQHSDLYISSENAAALKIHICGHAAREFQSMHDAFIRDNDPKFNLLKLRTNYLNDFKDIYCKTDQSEWCKRKADEFTNNCLQPAVIKYIQNSLGLNIYDENVTTRSSFQLVILKKLASADSTMFLKYIDNYEEFAQNVIQDMTNSKYSNTKVRHLMEICRKIKKAIAELQEPGGKLNFSEFRKSLCKTLSEDLAISHDTTGLDLKDVKVDEFSNTLTLRITEMETCLKSHSDLDVLKQLNSLQDPPHDKLYQKILGCKKLCPDCKVPCDAEGEGHRWHSATIHRPMEFQERKIESKLSTEMCTHHIKSTWKSFAQLEKYIRSVMYWRVQPYEATATNYWEFIFAKHNVEYAATRKCLPADIPEDWKAITEEVALLSLTKVFNPPTNNSNLATETSRKTMG